ncbi:tRNA (guanosine(46)-N7)-methyltransferase TrmB [candidate division KSB1 bacterium]|nr:tRNA (guanosine(46)-N7)-methyltransferase TrmB [candidate division KSB1 bacterium]
MARQKFRRINEANELPNVYDESGAQFRGRWKQDIFGNDRKLTLELGCGKGEFSLEMARRYPDRNFIGIDYKGYVLWKAGSVALNDALDNVKFLRMRIQNIRDFFSDGEVDEIWFVFPDPFPKNRHEKNRLFYPDFLPLYQAILKPQGSVHFKTDSGFLFDYASEVLHSQQISIDDSLSYHERGGTHDFHIATTYERKFLSKDNPINYLRFRFV